MEEEKERERRLGGKESGEGQKRNEQQHTLFYLLFLQEQIKTSSSDDVDVFQTSEKNM